MRAQGHVEMIVSFIIFIGFLSVLLYILNPVEQRRVGFAVLDITEQQLLKELSIDYRSLSLIVNNGVDMGSCFIIEYDSSIGFALVRDDNRVVPSKLSPGILTIDQTGERYFKIYSSQNFSNSPLTEAGCVDLDESSYNLVSLPPKNSVFFNAFEDLEESYRLDYDGLKEKLGIKNDFEFRVYDESGLIYKGEINKPLGIDIVARDIPLLAVDDNADTKSIVLNIGAW